MNAVVTIIERFGGVRPLARQLEIAPSVVQGWKDRNTIPSKRQQDLLNLAKARGVPLSPADFFTEAAA